MCYLCAAEPSHNNARTEASHALRQHDSMASMAGLHTVGSATFRPTALFLVFARSGVTVRHMSRMAICFPRRCRIGICEVTHGHPNTNDLFLIIMIVVLKT